MYTLSPIDLESFLYQAKDFLCKIDNFISSRGLELGLEQIDHLCFRVTNESEYQDYKVFLQSHARLLVESLVGGRAIATYKLKNAICYKSLKVKIIELPRAKENNSYILGFEHAEFVIEKSFETFTLAYPDLDFDFRGIGKTINPELRVKLPGGISIKLHHQSLEQVIEEES